MVMISNSEIMAFWLTVKLALSTMAILLVIGIPLAWWLSQSRSFIARIIESLVALPIVLPPTVLGFYLLIAFSPQTFIGGWFETLTNQQLAFSFWGILVGSLIYSLPFVIQPLQATFADMDLQLLETAYSLGASKWDSFINIVLPISRNGIISAGLLCFAHTVGEFGVILMIGGNIPGETQVLSIALFDAVESMEYDKAHTISAGLLIFAVLSLAVINYLKRPRRC